MHFICFLPKAQGGVETMNTRFMVIFSPCSLPSYVGLIYDWVQRVKKNELLFNRQNEKVKGTFFDNLM